MIKSTESEILQQFYETSAQNSVSEENHVEAVKDYVEYPKVVIDSAGSDWNDSVTDELPGGVSDEVLWHPTNIHNVNNNTVNLSDVDTLILSQKLQRVSFF